MRALVIHGAKDLRLEERPEPELAPGEVLVRVEGAGICGSDLHYVQHGGIGTAIRVKAPMVLGHEAAGRVVSGGDLEPGTLVAISPSRPCAVQGIDPCEECREGRQNHCRNMRFYGSAMPWPHIDGVYADALSVKPAQLHALGDHVTPAMAALAEPLAVCLHAVGRAGDVSGARALVTGCGPIGALCAAVLAHRGAEVTVTDLADAPLKVGRQMGAHHAVNVRHAKPEGPFDLMLECSGTEAAIAASIEHLRPRAVLVQVGMGGDMTMPMQRIVAREIEVRGAFRFHQEFAEAARLIDEGALALAPLLSASFPPERAADAFALAADRGRAMKVTINFGETA